MELLALVVIWPFLIFAIGLIFIAFVSFPSGGFELLGFIPWFFILFLVFLAFTSKSRRNLSHLTITQQLVLVRSWMITFSIALILPIFIRYIVDGLGNTLFSIVVGVIAGFAMILWGMFMKTNNTVMYGNVFGGALILLYIFFQLGQLGEFARIVVAGLSLAFAIFIAIIKFKDKLT